MRARFSKEEKATWRSGTWAVALLAGGLLVSASLTGCARNEQDGTASGVGGTGAAVTGSGELTTAGGGEGAGTTGTQGDGPADNPASQATEEQQKDEQ